MLSRTQLLKPRVRVPVSVSCRAVSSSLSSVFSPNPFNEYCRLLRSKSYAQAKLHLQTLISPSSFPAISSLLHSACRAHHVPAPLAFDMLYRVYAHSGLPDMAHHVFDEMLASFRRLDPRSCFVHLNSLRQRGPPAEVVAFFRRMLESDREAVPISVYCMSLVTDTLCKGRYRRRTPTARRNAREGFKAECCSVRFVAPGLW